MTFRETFYNVKQLMVDRLIDFGLEDADIDLGWTTLLTLAQNTRITIDVPLNLVYSDDFAITGTLETATYRRLAYKTLKLKVGNTVVATTETDINGTYSFTTSPVSMGNHSFQVIFEGTNIHQPSQSSVVNRTISKETSVINLDIIPTAHINRSTVVAGTLKSDDAELLKNKTMKLDTVSGNTLTTTTNNYGQFSFTLTDIPSFNNVSVTCYFEGDEYYSLSTITTPVAVYQETLELTSDKNILSYADNDYATLTVQYKDTGDMNLGAGKEIDLYKIYEVSGIQLTSDKDTLSYADNDTCILTATLKDSDNKTATIDGETVTFYKQTKNKITGDVTCPANTSAVVFNSDTLTPGESVEFNIQPVSNGSVVITCTDGSESLVSSIGSITSSSGHKVVVSRYDDMIDIILDGSGMVTSIESFNPSSVQVTSSVACTVSDILFYDWSTVGTGSTLSGVATCTYNSQGVGDVVFKAECNGIISTEIYIEDYVYYNATGCSFTSNSDTDRVEATGLESFEYTPSSKFELSFDIDDTSQFKRFYLVSKPQSTSTSNRYGIGANFQSNTNKIGMVVRTTSSDEQSVSYTPPRPVNVKFVIDGTTTTGYVDETLAVTKTISWWDTYAPYIFKWGIWGSGTATVTNIKVKAL